MSPNTPPELPANSAPVLAARPSQKRGSRRWIIPVAGCIATLALAALLGYRYWISTPQYSLLQAKSAFEAHDLNQFERYVAIDSCVDGLTDDLLAEASARLKTQTASEPNSFADMGRQIAEGMLGMLKPAIAGAIKTEARELVSTGQVSPVAAELSKGPVDLEQLKSNIASQGLHYDGLGDVTVDENTATVELRFRNGQKNMDQPLELEMQRVEGHWQVDKWKNAPQWIRQFAGTVVP